MEQVLLERDQFRELVFERDRNKCVICGAPGQDAHHITERRLFPDGGYYLDNGATLCGPCHWKAETTELSVSEILHSIGVTHRVLPPHLYPDQDYDKWGNPILANGRRLRGELFDDENVSKALSSSLHLFDTRVKYPRTYHLPFSPGVSSDDRVMESYTDLEGFEVVVTEKLDGENTSWYNNAYHARSVDSETSVWQHRVKAMWAARAHEIPPNYRICGENVYAQHSIPYSNLLSYFYVFGVWSGLTCLSWADTLEWAELLELPVVPILYSGLWNEEAVMELALGLDRNKQEGLVVRRTDPIHIRSWSTQVGKWVRQDHVQTTHHWKHQQIIPNKLIGE